MPANSSQPSTGSTPRPSYPTSSMIGRLSGRGRGRGCRCSPSTWGQERRLPRQASPPAPEARPILEALGEELHHESVGRRCEFDWLPAAVRWQGAVMVTELALLDVVPGRANEFALSAEQLCSSYWQRAAAASNARPSASSLARLCSDTNFGKKLSASRHPSGIWHPAAAASNCAVSAGISSGRPVCSSRRVSVMASRQPAGTPVTVVA